MNAPTKNSLQEKVDSLAADYARAGFEVVIEPSADDVPFNLGTYQPALVARKGDSGLIIEVKTSASRVSVDRLQTVAQQIAEHPDWRFLLVTLDDEDAKFIPATTRELPGWDAMGRSLQAVDLLIQQRALAPAVLYLWSIFEAALRRRAIDLHLPIERMPEAMLLKHLYSHGEISVDQIDSLREFLERRNRLAHGANDAVASALLTQWLMLVTELLAEWRLEIPA